MRSVNITSQELQQHINNEKHRIAELEIKSSSLCEEKNAETIKVQQLQNASVEEYERFTRFKEKKAKEIEELKKTINERDTKLRATEEHTVTLESKLEKERTRCQGLIQLEAKLKEELSSLEKQFDARLQEKENDTSKLAKEHKKLLSSKESLINELQMELKKKEKLHHEKLAEANQQTIDLMDKLEQGKKVIEENGEHTINLKSTIQELQSTLEAEKQQYTRTLTERDKHVSSLKQQLVSAEAEKLNREADAKSSSTTMEELKRSWAAELQKMASSHDKEIKKLREQVNMPVDDTTPLSKSRKVKATNTAETLINRSAEELNLNNKENDEQSKDDLSNKIQLSSKTTSSIPKSNSKRSSIDAVADDKPNKKRKDVLATPSKKRSTPSLRKQPKGKRNKSTGSDDIFDDVFAFSP